MDLGVLEGSGRRIWGLASSPEPDRENEIVTRAAMEEALHFFLKHPIIHYYHTERPIGILTKAWFQGNDLYVEGEIWGDESADDIWAAIQKGTLTQWSIYGRPRARTGPCSLPPSQRSSPCVTKALWLDSISLCPGGTAINAKTFADVVKALTLKATTTTNTALIHATPDGVGRGGRRTEIEKMVDTTEMPPAGPPEGGGEADPLEDRLASIEARLTAIEEKMAAPTEPEEENTLDDTPEVQKALDGLQTELQECSPHAWG